MNIADAMNYSSVFLLNLSDNNRNWDFFNIGVVQQGKVDWVGWLNLRRQLHQLDGCLHLMKN